LFRSRIKNAQVSYWLFRNSRFNKRIELKAILLNTSSQHVVPARQICLGVDIGGTNTKLGLVDPNGRILAQHTALTATLDQPQRVCDFIFSSGEQLASSFGHRLDMLEGVGVAMPGILDIDQGVLKEVSNLLQWINFPIKRELSQRFGRDVVVLNDASAAAFGEYTHRGRVDDSLALITLGTGIGSGVVIQGKPLGGAHGCAGEIGHAVIDTSPNHRLCGCGMPGHLEAYAGSAGVLTTMRQLLAQGSQHSSLSSYDESQLTPEIIAHEAEQGDAIAESTVLETARHLGVGISLLCQCIDPNVVLLGGAMTFGQTRTHTGRKFLAELIGTVRKYSLKQIGGFVSIEFAKLGSDAGILGAAAYARSIVT
jgi:glucokinase